MSTPTPDLDLRRRVLETQENCYGQIDAEKGKVLKAENKGFYTDLSECPEYEISFDAIMPLVRELSDGEMSKFVDALYFGIVTPRGAINWMCRRATPADYCRAYLSAVEKGEKE